MSTASNAQILHNVAVEDSSFFILNGEDNSWGVSFAIASLSASRTITMPDANVDLSNIGDVTALDDIATGDAASSLTTSVGDITINGKTGVSIQIDSVGQAYFGSAGVMTVGPDATYTINHDVDGAGEDFIISQTGTFDSSLVLRSTGTGSDAVWIDATAGGISIGGPGVVHLTSSNAGSNAIDIHASAGGVDIEADSGEVILDGSTGIKLEYGGVEVLKVSAGDTVTIKNDAAVTITHSTNNATDDLTFSVTGANDAGMYLTSEGLCTNAITVSSTAGGVSLASESTGMGGGITLNHWTTMHGISYSSSLTTPGQVVWSSDLGNDEATYYIKGTVISQDATSSLHGAYEISAIFIHDGNITLTQDGGTVKSGLGSGLGSGNTLALTGFDIDKDGDDPVIKVTPEQSTHVDWKGSVTVFKSMS